MSGKTLHRPDQRTHVLVIDPGDVLGPATAPLPDDFTEALRLITHL